MCSQGCPIAIIFFYLLLSEHVIVLLPFSDIVRGTGTFFLRLLFLDNDFSKGILCRFRGDYRSHFANSLLLLGLIIIEDRHFGFYIGIYVDNRWLYVVLH